VVDVEDPDGLALLAVAEILFERNVIRCARRSRGSVRDRSATTGGPGARLRSVPSRDQAAEAFSPRHRRAVVRGCGRRRDQPVLKPLVVALEVIVLDELADGETEVPFTERDQLVQAVALDGQHEPLGEGVEVRAVRRQLQASDASRAKDVRELLREERVSVVDQKPLAGQEAIDPISQIARHLLHPSAMRLPHDAADLHSSGFDVDDEEHKGANEARERQHLHGEEVDRAEGSCVRLEEGLPRHPLATSRGWFHAVAE
jgi:hypothetical protein